MPIIHFRTVIEVLGRPKEHVDIALRGYVEKLKQDQNYKVLHVEFADFKKQENQELWAGFAEVEAKAKSIKDLISFCFDYMPSLIEIIEPSELSVSEEELSLFLNDLQAKLHHVDMVAKQVKLENDFLKRNLTALLRNYVTVLLRKGGSMTSEQLCTLTGVDKDKLEDFLDTLLDEGKVDLKKGFYSWKENVA